MGIGGVNMGKEKSGGRGRRVRRKWVVRGLNGN